jgi:hypothetical protein
VSHSVSLFQRYCCERDNSDVRAFAGMYLPTTEYTSGWGRTYDAQLDDGAQSQVGRTATAPYDCRREETSVICRSIFYLLASLPTALALDTGRHPRGRHQRQRDLVERLIAISFSVRLLVRRCTMAEWCSCRATSRAAI